MKVLILAPAFHPTTGGAETYAKVVAVGLRERGHDVVVVTDGRRGSLPRNDTVGGVAVHRLSRYWELLADEAKLTWEQMSFSLLPELEELVAQVGVPDVVVVNSHEAAITGTMLAAQWPGTAVVATYHQQDRERGPVGVGRSRLVYGILPLDGILVGSEFYRNKAHRFGAPPERVHHVPHGVNTELFSGEPRRRAGRGLRLLLAGRIAPRKQQLFMVDVLARLRQTGVDAELTLVGEVHSSSWEYADAVKQRVLDSHVSEHVRFVSDVKHEQMRDMYAEADLVVQPSTEEGLGLAVLEAMACGVPVIVSDTVGLEEIVTSDEVGVRVPVGDEAEWTQQIRALDEDEERRLRMAMAGQELVRRAFNERTMLDSTVEVLSRVLAAGRSAETVRS